MVDISGFYNISSNAIRKAAESTSIQNASHSTGEFEGMLDNMTCDIPVRIERVTVRMEGSNCCVK